MPQEEPKDPGTIQNKQLPGAHISKVVELTPPSDARELHRVESPLLWLERFLTQLDSHKSHAQNALAKLRSWNLRRDDES